ncbi:MAG: S1C family serine protease [bacterium]
MKVYCNGFVTGLLAATVSVCLPVLASAQTDEGYRYEDKVHAATAIVTPSVVAVETRFEEPTLDSEYAYWSYTRGARPLYGLFGSGFIYKDPEYVITNTFITHDAEFVRVILNDGRSFKAEIVGESEAYKLAVLKVDWGPDFKPLGVQVGDSEKMKLGQPMAIVGKSNNNHDTFATSGIISAIRKEIPSAEGDQPTNEFIQFDAAWEHTFYGAPIVDVDGKVIGMVDKSVTAHGLNLGVPINEIVFMADRIISGDAVDTLWGVESQFVSPGLQKAGYVPWEFDMDGNGTAEPLEYGEWVSFVDANSPAEIGGLMAGDIIYQIDDTLIEFHYNYTRTRREFVPGQLVIVRFLRRNAMSGEWEKKVAQVQIVEDTSGDSDDEDGGGYSGNPHG